VPVLETQECGWLDAVAPFLTTRNRPLPPLLPSSACSLSGTGPKAVPAFTGGRGGLLSMGLVVVEGLRSVIEVRALAPYSAGEGGFGTAA
jgi:hypothetical protein